MPSAASRDRADVTVAVLAGGRGARLGGRDKGLEPLLGRELVTFAMRAARAMSDDVLIVANRNPDAYARHAPVVPDRIPGTRGPLAGVAAALARCRRPLLLTLPVDCPEPPEELFDRLSAALDAQAQAAVAHDGERRQPLFALYRRDLADDASRAAELGLGPAGWQDRLVLREVDFADRSRRFRNLNTPDDFRSFEEALAGA